MKYISWNVNGLRACMGKGFLDFLNREQPDFLCVQETKMQEGQAVVDTPGYYQYWHSAERKGYSGTLVLAREQAILATHGIGGTHTDEGRVITLEYPTFYLVNCYTPNAQAELLRLPYRLEFGKDFAKYLEKLAQDKPVIICGDLNVAHSEIDLKNPKANRGNPGFSDEERQDFTKLLDHGFTDSFRYLYPDLVGAYTWWSYRFQARAKNIGWRIDYFLVSNSIKDKIKESTIYSGVEGSDHCPVGLELNI